MYEVALSDTTKYHKRRKVEIPYPVNHPLAVHLTAVIMVKCHF